MIEGWSLISLLRGGIGMVVLIALSWLMSVDRRAIDWRVVGKAFAIQLVLALGVLYVPFVATIFEVIGGAFVKVLDFTRAGSQFVFGSLVDMNKVGSIFAFQILPTLIFFSALTSLFYYLGIIQFVVKGVAWLLNRSLKISGAEGLTTAGNIFLGMSEAPLMTKRYLSTMNRSEIFLVLVSGMATISGGIMAAYVAMLSGGDPASRIYYAKHLLSASVMAAPAAVMMAKIVVPQTESVESVLDPSGMKRDTSVLSALSNGTVSGLKLSVMVAATVLVFIAMIALLNYLLSGLLGEVTGLNRWIQTITDGRQTLTLEYILGLLFSPIVWLMGVNSADMGLVGGLLGKKIILNEFLSYADLSMLKEAGRFIEQKSIVMSTYLLCGFANIGSIGILIGAFEALAPNQKDLVARFGFRAMFAATLASCFTATIIGMII
ncbi:MAG: NupC/NupG family nucleoside CNT transporter [Bacteroidales bacterium]